MMTLTIGISFDDARINGETFPVDQPLIEVDAPIEYVTPRLRASVVKFSGGSDDAQSG